MKAWGWIIAFGVAFGFVEAAVVIYLRELYYPGGFDFPMVAMPPSVGMVELFREAATIIMLLAAGVLAGRTVYARFAYFLISFAVWDIFYYVFLKIFLDWPESIFTWDILFLIPLPWIGPVITPVIVSLTMALLAAVLLYREEVTVERLRSLEWTLLIVGSFIVVLSWTMDFISFSRSSSDHEVAVFSFTPQKFNWLVFFLGEGIILLAIFLSYRKVKKG